MADIFMYADESGNLDYDVEGKQGATPYFGFGTATFVGDHSGVLWGGHTLRIRVEQQGLNVPEGFHAKHDSWQTRHSVFEEIGQRVGRPDLLGAAIGRLCAVGCAAVRHAW